MLEHLGDVVLAHAGDPWVVLVVLALAAFDALVPPLPSESVVIALAAVSASGGRPDLLLLGACAAAGAWTGDNLTYALGRHSPLRRWTARSPRLDRAFRRAARELDRRGALAVLAARYVPVGRIAVNLTAGAAAFPRRRFLGLSALGAVTWAGYAVLVGALAGRWLQGRPLLGSAVGIAGALVLGLAVERFLEHVVRPRRRSAAEADGGAPGGAEPL